MTKTKSSLNSATLIIDINISISVSVLVHYMCRMCTASCCQQQQVAACALYSHLRYVCCTVLGCTTDCRVHHTP